MKPRVTLSLPLLLIPLLLPLSVPTAGAPLLRRPQLPPDTTLPRISDLVRIDVAEKGGKVGKGKPDGENNSPKGNSLEQTAGEKKPPSAKGEPSDDARGEEPRMEKADDVDGGEKMTASDILAEARSSSGRFMEGGFVEFLEWLFVFILVAPGTFPAMGCIVISFHTVWGRRPPPSAASAVAATGSSSGSRAGGLPRADGALVRARKGVGEEREDV